jgi:hypothetical protein
MTSGDWLATSAYGTLAGATTRGAYLGLKRAGVGVEGIVSLGGIHSVSASPGSLPPPLQWCQSGVSVHAGGSCILRRVLGQACCLLLPGPFDRQQRQGEE